MEPKIEIVNIVATLKLDSMPDPSEMLKKIPEARPLRRFRGALLRTGRTPVLSYKNKIVITGSKSMGELDNIMEKLINLLHEHMFYTKAVSREG